MIRCIVSKTKPLLESGNANKDENGELQNSGNRFQMRYSFMTPTKSENLTLELLASENWYLVSSYNNLARRITMVPSPEDRVVSLKLELQRLERERDGLSAQIAAKRVQLREAKRAQQVYSLESTSR